MIRSSHKKDQVFVLSTVPYKGSDLVVNFLARESGKLTAVIYGGRKINKTSSFLYQPGDLIEVEYEKNENKEFVKILNSMGLNLINCDRFSYQRFLFHSYLLDLIGRISKPELASPEIFDVLTVNNSFPWKDDNSLSYIVWTLWKLIQAGGYQIDFSRCNTCQKQTWRMSQPDHPSFRKQMYYLEHTTGSLICADCVDNAHQAALFTPSMIKVLWLYTKTFELDHSLKNLPSGTLQSLVKVLNHYLLANYEIKPKSLEVFLQMINANPPVPES